MTDRTSINIAQDEHKATRDVKNEYGESWTDVLRFYREHRPDVGIPVYEVGGSEPVDHIPAREANTDGADVDELAREIRKLSEQVERVPQDTADELEGRFR